MYPRTRPAIANPFPVSRPPLLRMSERDKCPKMTAASENGRMINNSPLIRLKIALPLVSGGSPKATAGSTAGPADAANESRPQTPQKRSPSDILFPQPGQNELIDSSSLQHVLSRGYGGRFVGRH